LPEFYGLVTKPVGEDSFLSGFPQIKRHAGCLKCTAPVALSQSADPLTKDLPSSEKNKSEAVGRKPG
jgi:hypothetical protein